MILKSRITNLDRKPRVLDWAGITLQPGESRIVEGVLPTDREEENSEVTALKEQMKASLKSGSIRLEIITDLPVLSAKDLVTVVETTPRVPERAFGEGTIPTVGKREKIFEDTPASRNQDTVVFAESSPPPQQAAVPYEIREVPHEVLHKDSERMFSSNSHSGVVRI